MRTNYLFSSILFLILYLVLFSEQTALPSNPNRKHTDWELLTDLSGFDHPESAHYHLETDSYYIGNARNGTRASSISKFLASEHKLVRDWCIFPITTQIVLGVTSNQRSVFANALDEENGPMVHECNLRSGKHTRSFNFKNLEITILNDISSDGLNILYLTDTGFIFDMPGQPSLNLNDSDRFTNTDAVYMLNIQTGKVLKLLSSNDEGFGSPNGILLIGEKLLVNQIFGNKVWLIDKFSGNIEQTFEAPSGGLDGIEQTLSGNFLINSVTDEKVFLFCLDSGEFKEIISGVYGHDIGYDSERSIVLFPHMTAQNDDLELISKVHRVKLLGRRILECT